MSTTTSFIDTIKSLYPDKISNAYLSFLHYFPAQLQPFVSIVFGLIVIYVVYRIIKRDFIFIIALVILVPAYIPILQSIWFWIVDFLKFIFSSAH
jgi:hypothetical protein